MTNGNVMRFDLDIDPDHVWHSPSATRDSNRRLEAFAHQHKLYPSQAPTWSEWKEVWDTTPKLCNAYHNEMPPITFAEFEQEWYEDLNYADELATQADLLAEMRS